jgi:hypothetical protein
MLHINFIPWALALLQFIRVSIDISGHGNDCLKIAWKAILGNTAIQTLFESACEQTLEIRALIAMDETFNLVVMNMLTSKIFHALANEVIRQFRVAFISKQQSSFRGRLKATSHNNSDKSLHQQSEENIHSSITNQPKSSSTRKRVEKSSLELMESERKKSKKMALASYPYPTKPGVNKKKALDGTLRDVRRKVRPGIKIQFKNLSSIEIPPTTSIMSSSTASQHLRLPTSNIGPPTTFISQTGFFFHPAPDSLAEDMKE